MTIGRDIWILVRLGGFAALGLAGALWIFYNAIGPADESELETVSGTVVYRALNRHKSSITSQTLTVRTADGEETKYRLPYTITNRDGRHKIDVSQGARVTLKVSEHGNVYAGETRGRTLLEYRDGRDWHATRRLIPGILATTATLLALVLALISYFGPRLLDDADATEAAH